MCYFIGSSGILLSNISGGGGGEFHAPDSTAQKNRSASINHTKLFFFPFLTIQIAIFSFLDIPEKYSGFDGLAGRAVPSTVGLIDWSIWFVP